MGGSGGGTNTTTTKNNLPAYLKAYSKELTGEAQNLYSGALPQQSVAPLTADQQAAISDTQAETAPTTAALTSAQNANTAIASGANLSPSTNQYLQQYYNAAAAPTIENYEQAVAPNILSNAVASGGLGSAGEEQAFTNAQNTLGQNLSNLAANIYEPAYETALGQQATAIGQAPALASGQYIPSTQLNTVGTQQQQQQQNVLNTAYANAMAPYNALSTQAGLISPLAGGSGSQVTVSPNQQATSK
jgi:hypothetical protein